MLSDEPEYHHSYRPCSRVSRDGYSCDSDARWHLPSVDSMQLPVPVISVR